MLCLKLAVGRLSSHPRLLLLAGSLVITTTVALSASASAAPSYSSNPTFAQVCPTPSPGHVSCLAEIVTNGATPSASPGVTPNMLNDAATSSPMGLSPTGLDSVYGFPSATTTGTGETIAIVDAYHDPTIQDDLSAFSAEYGLPQCFESTGCLTEVGETGGDPTAYQYDVGWSMETSLDVEWVHAVAPGAQILLVDAASSTASDIFAAESYASSHANFISDSWGGPEFAGEQVYDAGLATPGKTFFAAAGDTPATVEYPSSSPDVISVGGTSLSLTPSGQLASETAWTYGGGGCSVYETASLAQSSFPGYSNSHCNGARATPDIAADADPLTGLAVYDSNALAYNGVRISWFELGGTSAATAIVAGWAADNATPVTPSTIYGPSLNLRAITSGSNGYPSTPSYNLDTGRGVWVGPTAPTPLDTAPTGYYLAAADGGVFAFGSATYYGSMGSRHLDKPVVGISTTPDGKGYWMVASDGGVFAFGDANYYGSLSHYHLIKPIVGMTSTPDGKGYWLVASDGGVFAFGDALYYGSMATTPLVAPVVSITPTPDDGGYWLTAADGGVFSFGDAGFFGSLNGVTLPQPIAAIATTSDGLGYWQFGADGSVYPSGDAGTYGQITDQTLAAPVVAAAATPDGKGYWLVASDGGVFSYGASNFYGSMGGKKLNRPVVAIAPV